MRKQVLLARSSLYRLRMSHEIGAVRESARWPRIGIALASSPAGRAALFGLLAPMIIGRGRMARLVRGAAIALAVAKLARSAAARFKR
jgi:hypothetical protein